MHLRLQTPPTFPDHALSPLSWSLPTLSLPPKPSSHPPFSTGLARPHQPGGISLPHCSLVLHTHLKIKHGFRKAIVSCLYSYLTLTLTMNSQLCARFLPNQRVSSLRRNSTSYGSFYDPTKPSTPETLQYKTQASSEDQPAGWHCTQAPSTHLVTTL